MISCRLITNIFCSYDIEIDLINSIFLYLSQCISFFICCYLLYLIYCVYPETSDKMLDNKIPFYYIVIPTFLLACLLIIQWLEVQLRFRYFGFFPFGMKNPCLRQEVKNQGQIIFYLLIGYSNWNKQL